MTKRAPKKRVDQNAGSPLNPKYEKQRSLYFLAIALAIASGAAALGHEVILSRRLIDLLGASNTSVSRVFGCFFLGLSLGAVSSRRYMQWLGNPWKAAGIAELGVALLVVPTLWIAGLTDWIWPMVGGDGLGGWSSWLIKLALSVAIILPPAFCMGLFLPCLARAVLTGERTLARQGVWLYAFNTLGGVLGIFLVSMVLIASVGVDRTVIFVVCINLAAGTACLVVGNQTSALASQASESASSSITSQGEEIRGRRLIYFVSFLSGFGVLALEMLALQVVTLNTPLCYYATPTMLITVILVLAASAWILPRLTRLTSSLNNLIGLILLAIAMLSLIGPFWFRMIAPHFLLMETASLTGFWWSLGLFSLAAFGPIFLVAGLLFPSAAAWVGEIGNDRTGASLGRLLAINGIGGLLGAEAVFGLAMPWLGVYSAVATVALVYCCAAFLWGKLVTPGLRNIYFAITLLLLAASMASIALNQLSPHVSFKGIAILEEKGGREGIVSVIHSDQMGLRIAMSGQYVLGGTKYRFDQERMAHLPMMLHKNPQSVGFLGLATGISAGAVLEHRSVTSLQIAELAPLVVRAAGNYFDPFNHSVTKDPRARIVTEDARIFIAANPGMFDVVVGDLFLPWAPGEARLYSVEHFRSVRASLKPGGLYCQWLAAYQLNAEQLNAIQSSLSSVFPRMHLFRYNFDDLTPALALVAFGDEGNSVDWSVVETRCQTVRQTSQVTDPLMRHPEGLAMMYLGSSSSAEFKSGTNTLANMTVELSAGKVRVSSIHSRGYLSGDQWLKYISQRSKNWQVPEHLGNLLQVGNQLTLFQVGQREFPTLSTQEIQQFELLKTTLAAALPEAFKSDSEADLEKWPGDSKRLLEK